MVKSVSDVSNLILLIRFSNISTLRVFDIDIYLHKHVKISQIISI
jgi:hypothetical protein